MFRAYRVYLLFLLGYPLIFFYQYNVNPDGISYLDIARRYASGDFQSAVNDYWSPLFSWLIAPFIKLGLDAFMALYTVQFFLALILLIYIKKIVDRFQIAENVKHALLIGIFPVLIYWSVSSATPDLLFTTLVVIYLNLLLSKKFFGSMKKTFECGLIGALMYFSKSYAMLFFLVNFLIFHLICLFIFKVKQKKVLTSLIFGYLFFFIISLPWVILISKKSGYFTIGTAFAYNHSVIGPAGNAFFFNNDALMKPFSSSSTSVWEYPSYLMETLNIQPWNPFSSMYDFVFQLRVVFVNLLRAAFELLKFSIFSMPIIFYSLFILFKAFYRRKRPEKSLVIILCSLLTFPLGYLFIIVEGRYLWPVFAMLLVLGFIYLDRFVAFVNNKLFGKIVFLVFILSFWVYPVYYLQLYFNVGKDEVNFYRRLQQTYKIEGMNIASNSKGPATLVGSFILKSRYFGQTGSDLSDYELADKLAANDIDYYFFWEDGGELPKISYKWVFKSPGGNLAIFEL